MPRIWLVSVAVLLLAAAPAFAQGKKKGDSQTRNVEGVVTSADQQPISRAVVYLKNTKTLQIRSFYTKDDGTYYFHGLNTDIDYELRAEYQGLSSPTKTLSSFDNRKDATIDLKLSPKK